MKLNNKGWGLGFLIIVGVLFLLILIFVSLRIRALTHQFKDNKKDKKETSEKSSVNTDLYRTLEASLEKAGESYSIYHLTLMENSSDHVIVWYETLKNEGFIESLPDPEAEGECKGYVMIKDEDSVESFVKCSKYETLNYDLWVD